MARASLLVALPCLLASAAGAQPASDAPPARVKVAVLDIAASDQVGKDLPAAIGALIGQHLSDSGALDVLTQDDVRQMIGFDRLKTALSCDDEASCLAEIGGALGVPYLVAGRLAKAADDKLVLSLSLIAIDDASIAGREVLEGTAPELMAGLRAMVLQLARPLLAGREGDLVLTVEPEGALVEIDGRAIGESPLPGPVTLAQGPHKLRIKREGYFAVERDVDIAPGDALALTVELEAAELDDDPRFLLIGGGSAMLVGALTAAAGYGGAAFIGYSAGSIPAYQQTPLFWLYVPVGGLVYGYGMATDPAWAAFGGPQIGGLTASTAVVQMVGAAVFTAGAALITWALLD